jgi:uncharacterized protein (DUF924 family)
LSRCYVKDPWIDGEICAAFEPDLIEMARLFETLADNPPRQSPQRLGVLSKALDFARRHADVIARFGRFPHRNAIPSRASSTEEKEYRRGPDAGF